MTSPISMRSQASRRRPPVPLDERLVVPATADCPDVACLLRRAVQSRMISEPSMTPTTNAGTKKLPCAVNRTIVQARRGRPPAAVSLSNPLRRAPEDRDGRGQHHAAHQCTGDPQTRRARPRSGPAPAPANRGVSHSRCRRRRRGCRQRGRPRHGLRSPPVAGGAHARATSASAAARMHSTICGRIDRRRLVDATSREH